MRPGNSQTGRGRGCHERSVCCRARIPAVRAPLQCRCSSSSSRRLARPATHTLLYDPNGRTAGGTQASLAVLENGGTVDAAHIHMV